ncbi:MAG: divalent metal cation transporter [Bacteroidales bacterium]|nr:divalent metal cation transporter [Bacteroidales bacterium]MCF8390125.1 divalent metal cation transporter [Bacteroidales bacterium]
MKSEIQEKIVKGMPMFAPGDPEILTRERKELTELQSKGRLARIRWYFSKSGPGWMQSAMTLGGGSAMASLFAGAFLQYKLLWVQPLAMVLGIIMLSALAHQTLSTKTRPFYAMKQFVSPALAWAWAIFALIATIIWHFPQYALAAGMADDIIKALTGIEIVSQTKQTFLLLGLGLFFLGIGIAVSWNYGNGRKGIKIFENIIKIIIWFIIFSFATVVIISSFSENGIEWGKVFRGFVPFSFTDHGINWNIPTDKRGISILIASFSAAVGINMTFLFGYSFLAKGWGKEHKGLAKFDLITGMLLPYTLATALMIIAAGTTIYGSGTLAADATNLSPIQAAGMLEAAGIPPLVSRLIFGMGIIGMAVNAIILHMLVSGFAVCEIFGIEPQGWKYKLATLIPAPGFLGVILWSKIGTWIAIPTSAISLIMLPVAYIGFFLLNNSEKYLGKDMPTGRLRFWWNTGMIVAILVTLASVTYYLITVVPTYFEKWF